MTAANPDRWAAPNYTRFTGSDATSLQQTFQSLSNYLEKINNSVTIASGAGVLSLTGTANQITVSASTGAVTLSFPTNITLVGGITLGGNVALTANSTRISQNTTSTWSGDAGAGFGKLEYHSNRWYFNAGSNSTEVVRFRRGAADVAWIDNSGGFQSFSTQGNANVAGTGNAINAISGIYSTGTNWLYGQVYMNGNKIGTGDNVAHGASQIYASDWFRSWGNTGWYNQTYGGGWVMLDTTWIRSYNAKNVYLSEELRYGLRFTSNASRQRGSYGAHSFGSNGISNTWDGIEFLQPTMLTLMMQANRYSGVYRDNSSWNWLFDFSTLAIGSDIRYKRDVKPLNIGLNFIKKLEPISYLKLTESPDDDQEETECGYYYGFSAQNVRAALDACGETRDVKIHNIGGPNMGLVACTEDAVYDRQYLGVTEFMGPVVLAIKELDQRLSLLEGTV